jgi:tetratricopeptide (TPR) repeat protein
MELGPVSEEARGLSGHAAERLAAAGAKAAARGDVRAATHLLDRAVALRPAGDVRRLRLLPSLARTLLGAGDWARSEEILTEAVGEGRATGDRWVAADAAVALTHLRLFTGPAMTHETARQELAQAELVFREFGDEAGLARAVGLAAQMRLWSGEAAAAMEELERAARHAHSAGDRLQEIESLHYVLISAMHGPVTVTAGRERTDRIQGEMDGDHRLKVTVIRARALFDAMSGDFAGARAGIAAALTLAEQLGLGVDLAGAQSDASEIEVLAGRPDAAEQVLRISVAAMQKRGDQGHLATVAPLLADALYLQGRHDEAMPLTELVARTALLDDLDPQVAWRRVQAKVLAQRGEFASAERLAREAVSRAARSDYLNLHARAVEDLAEVLRLAGRPLEARAELEVAIGLHDQKGDLVSAARARARRDELADA